MNSNETRLQLLTTIELIYDSILDQSQWPKAMKAVATFVGGAGVGHFLVSSAGTLLEANSVDIDPESTEEYHRYYGARDIRIPPAMQYPVGRVLTERIPGGSTEAGKERDL